MVSRLPKDRTLERKVDEKYKNYSPPVPYLLQAQQALALLLFYLVDGMRTAVVVVGTRSVLEHNSARLIMVLNKCGQLHIFLRYVENILIQ